MKPNFKKLIKKSIEDCIKYKCMNHYTSDYPHKDVPNLCENQFEIIDYFLDNNMNNGDDLQDEAHIILHNSKI